MQPDKYIKPLLVDVDKDVSSWENLSDSEIEDNEDVESDTYDDSSNDEESQNRSSPGSQKDEPDLHFVPSVESSCLLTFLKNSIRTQNGHVWATNKRHISSKRVGITDRDKGPAHALRNISDPMLLFEQFMTDQILEEIVTHTNSEIQTKRQNYSRSTSTLCFTSKEEIKALIGILVLTASLKDNHLNLSELFNTEYSGMRYVSCVSKERCQFLLRCLRFDDEKSRAQRQEDDPFTSIRNIWDILMVQCCQNYIPGNNVTIDDQLLAFRGKCPFKMFMPNKPVKYGIKMETMCDSATSYIVNSTPHLGTKTVTGGTSLSEYFVKELTRSIHGTNRNVTMNNSFASVSLAKQLLQPTYKLTLIGALRPNEGEVPDAMKNNRSRKVNTAIFCYDGPLTLLSYKRKSSNMIYLLSSSDEKGSVNAETKKPHMVEFYNSTKGGVSKFDKMSSVISCSRKTDQWALCVFYAMINVSCINSYLIYCHNSSARDQKVMIRRDYMKAIHSQLVEPWLKIRLQNRAMATHVKNNIRVILGMKTDEDNCEDQLSCSSDLHPVEAAIMKKRKSCGLCSYKKRRMTKTYCTKCNIPICGEHKVEFCSKCIAKN